MAEIKKIQWIIIIANDVKKLKEFYSEKLRFRIVREVVEDGFVQFQLGKQFFALFDKNKVAEILGPEFVTDDFKKAKTIYSFSEPENFDEQYETLKSQGVEFIKEPAVQPWGQKTAYFADPEGNIWEIQKWGD